MNLAIIPPLSSLHMYEINNMVNRPLDYIKQRNGISYFKNHMPTIFIGSLGNLYRAFHKKLLCQFFNFCCLLFGKYIPRFWLENFQTIKEHSIHHNSIETLVVKIVNTL